MAPVTRSKTKSRNSSQCTEQNSSRVLKPKLSRVAKESTSPVTRSKGHKSSSLLIKPKSSVITKKSSSSTVSDEDWPWDSAPRLNSAPETTAIRHDICTRYTKHRLKTLAKGRYLARHNLNNPPPDGETSGCQRKTEVATTQPPLRSRLNILPNELLLDILDTIVADAITQARSWRAISCRLSLLEQRDFDNASVAPFETIVESARDTLRSVRLTPPFSHLWGPRHHRARVTVFNELRILVRLLRKFRFEHMQGTWQLDVQGKDRKKWEFVQRLEPWYEQVSMDGAYLAELDRQVEEGGELGLTLVATVGFGGDENV